MEWKLNAIEARVLGALVEKASTTPDYYPLTLNALVNACNQKSNRDPFLTLEEDEVRQALHTLGDKGLASGAPSSGRVAKYEHHMQEVFNLGRREEAVVCVLLLRGAQTPGELRGRTERLVAFENLSDVQSTLERLIERDPPLVRGLSRQPGTKEVRYVQLLSSDLHAPEGGASETAPGNGTIASPDAVSREELTQLRDEMNNLRDQVGEIAAQLLALERGNESR